MQYDFYFNAENIEVSFLTFDSKILTFKSEVKNLTFNLSIVRLELISDSLEKTIERKQFLSQILDDKPIINLEFGSLNSDKERVEMHLTLFDEHLNSRYFYFNIGQRWTGGGRFFVRSLD